MSHGDLDTQQYYLGISGEQAGPFSEQDILNKIRQRSIPSDALIWFEGLSDWQPILSIEYFQQAFAQSQDSENLAAVSAPVTTEVVANNYVPPVEAQPQTTQANPIGSQNDASAFMSSGSSMKPVFSDSEGVFHGAGGSKFLGSRILIILFGVTLIGGGGAAYFFFDSIQGTSNHPSKHFPPKRGVQNVKVVKTPDINKREMKFRKAMSDLLLNPGPSLGVLKKLVEEDPKDKIGKEALEAAIEYYTQNRQFSDAGRLLMTANRPLEASQLFLSQPPSYSEAEKAIFAAYKISDDVNKRDLLLQDIRLLLSHVNNVSLAEQRIRLLEKEFPNRKHPFGYYLKPIDKRIADLFNRISFHFVQKLLFYIDSEFPHLNLVNRPVVSIEKVGREKYRIVGNYKGDVVLSEDKLEGIFMSFWLLNEQWFLVDTNLTIERGKWARMERDKMKDKIFSSEETLHYMETVFKSQFPKHAFHESVKSREIHNKNINN